MWARAVPYAEFGRLRREAPVAWSADEGPGFWSVSRYADIVAASRDVATFSSSRGVSFEDPTDEDMAARRTIIDTDPPGEAFDFVDAVAKEVPIRVLAQVMGLPAANLDLFIDLGDRLIANTDPEITDVVWGRDDTDAYRRFPFRSPYGKRLWDLGREVVAGRLREPGDDLLSKLLRAEVDGDRLSETDLDNFFSILVVAGNETTRIAIAQGVLAFCQCPEQWDRLRAGPELIEAATDEVIRWSCPTHFMRRTAAADTELSGRGSGPGTRWCSGMCPGTGTRPSSPTPTRSTWAAAPTGTCPSAAAGRTCAWACTWPGWRSRWCWPAG